MYFSFGYDFKTVGIGLNISEKSKDDLIGYGYDIAPKLVSLNIEFLFFKLIIGKLIIK